MRFVNHIVGKRTGLQPDDYSEVWTPEHARARLKTAKPANNYAEFLSASLSPDGRAPPGKLYLDRDRYYDKTEPSPAEVQEENETVIRNVQAIIEALGTDSNDLSYVIATRHGFCPKDGRWKQSHRPFIQGMSIRYTDIPAVIKCFGQDGFWDMSVYKHSEQLLATVSCCKGLIGKVCDGRVLTPQRDCLDPLCYLAQYVEEGWGLLDLPEGFGHEEEPVKPCVTDMSKDQLSVCPIFVSHLTACLNSDTSDDRVKWLNIGLVLKNLGWESDRFFGDWLAFSRKSAKYGSQGERDCEKVWAGLTPRGACSIGTLCFHARFDNPTAYAVAKRAERNRARARARAREAASILPHIDGAVDKSVESFVSNSVCALLKKSDPDRYAGINEETFSAVAEPGLTMRLLDSSIGMNSVMSYPNCSIRNGDNDSERAILGPMLIKNLNKFHSDFHHSAVAVYTRSIDDRGDISELRGTGESENKSITIHDLFAEKSGKTKLDTKVIHMVGLKGKATVTNKMALVLEEILLPQLATQFTAATGVSANNWFQLNVQNMHLHMAAGEDDKRQSDEMLAVALLEGAPELIERIVFAPDAASGAYNGLYYCDPVTNIWAREHNAQIHQIIKAKFEGVKHLSSADTKFVQTVKGQDTLRHVLAGKLGDKTFASRIDANLDVFACTNGVFDSSDSSKPPYFRPIKVSDVVETTTGWAYDAEAAREHRAELETFLEQLLPFPDERQVVLTYMAHLMSGRRTAKKFLVLTDRRDGHNGKSSLAKMLLSFFGKLAMRNTPFVCKGSFDKDKSSHDAALGPTRGKRLLVADELKHTMTLDVAMFKDKAGGVTQVSGRAFGSSQQYDYTWQAGFLLIFNENDCPKIDVADQAFIGRMIVAPMRSKFIDVVGEEPYTYLMDADLDKKFDLWRSALADILMQPKHQKLILLRNVPATMSEWRQGVAQGANPVAEWLDQRVVVTGDKTDYILLATVEGWKSLFCADSSISIGNADFRKLAKAHLMGDQRVEFRIQAYIHGKKMNALFFGLALRQFEGVD